MKGSNSRTILILVLLGLAAIMIFKAVIDIRQENRQIDRHPVLSPTPTPTPEPTQEPTLDPTPTPEPTPDIDHARFSLINLFKNHGTVIGKLGKDRYITSAHLTEFPCTMRVQTRWETYSDGNLRAGQAVLDLKFFHLAPPTVKVYKKNGHGACRIEIQRADRKNFRVGDNFQRTLLLYLDEENVCDQAVEAFGQAIAHCAD